MSCQLNNLRIDSRKNSVDMSDRNPTMLLQSRPLNATPTMLCVGQPRQIRLLNPTNLLQKKHPEPIGASHFCISAAGTPLQMPAEQRTSPVKKNSKLLADAKAVSYIQCVRIISFRTVYTSSSLCSLY
jgi:hypothetical protein